MRFVVVSRTGSSDKSAFTVSIFCELSQRGILRVRTGGVSPGLRVNSGLGRSLLGELVGAPAQEQREKRCGETTRGKRRSWTTGAYFSG
jgi:hypothetical protein